MNKTTTPNALPPTMITLGEPFNCASISIDLARKVASVQAIQIGNTVTDKEQKKKFGYPYRLIDLRGTDGGVLLRSKELRVPYKAFRKIMRETTRKVATFVFENQGIIE